MPRPVIEVSRIRKTYGNRIFVDLVTCYSGLPEGFHPDNTVVYPGHGPNSTIGAERIGNPYLRIR